MKLTNETIKKFMVEYYCNTLPLISLTKSDVRKAVESVTSETDFEKIFNEVDVFNLEDILESICLDFRILVAQCLMEINFKKMNKLRGEERIKVLYPLLKE